MKIQLSKRAERDLDWFDENQPKLSLKIEELIADIQIHPETGLGKPERLRHDLSGCWSRRINKEHHLVYRIEESGEGPVLIILSCRFYYEG